MPHGYFDLLIITSDGKRIISNHSQICTVFDIKKNEVIKSLEGHKDRVMAIAITLDGKYAISGEDSGPCIIWDLSTSQSFNQLEGKYSARVISITPDSKIVISSNLSECIHWMLQSGEIIRRLHKHTLGINDIAITPDGKKYITCSGDKSLFLWDVKTSRILKSFQANSIINTICITPDGKKMLTGSGGFSRTDDTNCILWDIESGEKIGMVIRTSTISKISYYPGGFIIGDNFGKIFIVTLSKDLLYSNVSIVTIKRIWNYELHMYLEPIVDCPLCGHRFTPSASVLVAIERITKKTKLRPEQSPCLELPDEAWEKPGLLSNCPNCNGKLKFNPFIAGEQPQIRPKWKFW
jgi:WD40 repeat protein